MKETVTVYGAEGVRAIVGEAERLRARVAELEAALREVCEAHRSRIDPADTWCKRCGSSWRASEHIGGCPVGRALRVLGDAGVPGGAVASEGRCAGPVPDDLATGGTR